MIRNIKVLVEKDQSVIEFNNVDVTYLKDLKELLTGKGVHIEPDDVFKEARSKSILTSDEAILPSNIPWRGEMTNDLTFMITVANKKIKSGGYDRKYLYKRIKELNLQDIIKKEEGKNFTQVASDILYHHIQAKEYLDNINKIVEMCKPSVTEDIVAVIVPSSELLEQYPDDKILSQIIRQEAKIYSLHLAPYKRPVNIVVQRTPLPKTTTRKIKRKEVKDSLSLV